MAKSSKQPQGDAAAHLDEDDVTAARVGMTAEALAYLREHGGDAAQTALEHLDTAVVATQQSQARADAEQAAIAASFTVAKTAVALGLSRSGVAHRIRTRRMYSFTVARRRYVPRWQFQPADTVGRLEPIPGLARVASAIPAQLHPLAVESFMTTRLVDFDARSPAEHLRSGGNPETIAGWLTAMGHVF